MLCDFGMPANILAGRNLKAFLVRHAKPIREGDSPKRLNANISNSLSRMEVP
jgi:hypothetical protein